MLVLTRRIDESISIGSNVTVRVLRVDGRRVRIGISAPQAVPVQRTEVVDSLLPGHARHALMPAVNG